jgi:hypothetical protein
MYTGMATIPNGSRGPRIHIRVTALRLSFSVQKTRMFSSPSRPAWTGEGHTLTTRATTNTKTREFRILLADDIRKTPFICQKYYGTPSAFLFPKICYVSF